MQAQILNLLMDLREKMGLSFVFISHNIKVVKIISDRILVMHSGIIVEIGAKNDICSRPKHPYTQVLMTPFLNKPSNFQKQRSDRKKCVFIDHCCRKSSVCAQDMPLLQEIDKDHWVACFNPL
jgi:oligopeptide/dipeptide ABC transporter ATP-binding protein